MAGWFEELIDDEFLDLQEVVYTIKETVAWTLGGTLELLWQEAHVCHCLG